MPMTIHQYYAHMDDQELLKENDINEFECLK